MARMMERIPYSHPLVRSLPTKELPGDFYASFGRNKRCFPVPLSNQLAKYSVDDLHRIEAILETQTPSTRDFTAAKRVTAVFITTLESPACGVGWTDRERSYFRRKYGSQRQQKAVQIYRATRHLELAFPGSLSSLQQFTLQAARSLVTPDLKKQGVDVPDDLSFRSY
jgi:hypothetical protein